MRKHNNQAHTHDKVFYMVQQHVYVNRAIENFIPEEITTLNELQEFHYIHTISTLSLSLSNAFFTLKYALHTSCLI